MRPHEAQEAGAKAGLAAFIVAVCMSRGVGSETWEQTLYVAIGASVFVGFLGTIIARGP